MDDREIWPELAYVPGRTPRHPEGTFDAVRDTARAGMTPQQLSECTAFRLGLRYLETGYYWEAHELFEPVWMVLPKASPERQFVQCLIQIANGYLKLKMDRPKAAARLVEITRGLAPGGTWGTEDHLGAIMGVEMIWVQTFIDSLDVRIKLEL